MSIASNLGGGAETGEGGGDDRVGTYIVGVYLRKMYCIGSGRRNAWCTGKHKVVQLYCTVHCTII
jgi:hypothetical protein